MLNLEEKYPKLHRVRQFLLEVVGAAALPNWILGLLALIQWLAFLAEIPILLSVALLVGIWAVIEYCRAASAQEPFLPRLRTVWLKVCGVAGASHFTLAWIMLLTASGVAFPPLLVVLLPIMALLIAVYIVYRRNSADPENLLDKIHSFVSQVLGAGGAISWLLGVCALACASVFVFPPLVFIIVPAVVMGLSFCWWKFNKTSSVSGERAVEKSIAVEKNVEGVMPGGGKQATGHTKYPLFDCYSLFCTVPVPADNDSDKDNQLSRTPQQRSP